MNMNRKLIFNFDVESKHRRHYYCLMATTCCFSVAMLLDYLRWYFLHSFTSVVLNAMLLVETLLLLFAAIMFLGLTFTLSYANKQLTFCTVRKMPSFIRTLLFISDIWAFIIVLSMFRVGGLYT